MRHTACSQEAKRVKKNRRWWRRRRWCSSDEGPRRHSRRDGKGPGLIRTCGDCGGGECRVKEVEGKKAEAEATRKAEEEAKRKAEEEAETMRKA